ncbi:MAG: hypothetical protein E3J56_14750 [Candidatus Aminicenantes bacterium]|nr:MAG: hypothetical protein E3J56_14750 [Candidatus Aminicenantes bacterium]
MAKYRLRPLPESYQEKDVKELISLFVELTSVMRLQFYAGAKTNDVWAFIKKYPDLVEEIKE